MPSPSGIRVEADVNADSHARSGPESGLGACPEITDQRAIAGRRANHHQPGNPGHRLDAPQGRDLVGQSAHGVAAVDEQVYKLDDRDLA
jgi:hypothetical protein